MFVGSDLKGEDGKKVADSKVGLFDDSDEEKELRK
jgi:hypothetical protein